MPEQYLTSILQVQSEQSARRPGGTCSMSPAPPPTFTFTLRLEQSSSYWVARFNSVVGGTGGTRGASRRECLARGIVLTCKDVDRALKGRSDGPWTVEPEFDLERLLEAAGRQTEYELRYRATKEPMR